MYFQVTRCIRRKHSTKGQSFQDTTRKDKDLRKIPHKMRNTPSQVQHQLLTKCHLPPREKWALYPTKVQNKPLPIHATHYNTHTHYNHPRYHHRPCKAFNSTSYQRYSHSNQYNSKVSIKVYNTKLQTSTRSTHARFLTNVRQRQPPKLTCTKTRKHVTRST